jgi:branched-chain amino acid aminotransferase
LQQQIYHNTKKQHIIMTETTEFDVRKIAKSRLSEVDFSNLAFGKHFADHMFVAEFKNGEWQKAQIQPYEPISMFPANAALHYGQSIFEGLKAFKNQEGEVAIFRPYENFKRFNISAARMCMPQVPEEIFIGGMTELINLDRNWVPNDNDSSLYIRPFMFASDEFLGVKPSEGYKFMIFCCPVGAYYNAPVKVKIENHYTRASIGGTGVAKCAGNYAASLYPAQQAMKQGFQQLLWTDAVEHKYIEESGTMNVMFIIDNTLITAPTGDTILDGVTRKSVLTIARDWGMKVEERRVGVAEVIEAAQKGTLTEAFGAGTAATIANIIEIGYEDKIYRLPEIEKRTFSPKVFQELEDIKRGRVADTREWMLKV